MDKSILEKALYAFVNMQIAKLECGKKTNEFVMPYGDYVNRYALWGSKLFYSIRKKETVIQEGFVLIDEMNTAVFEQYDNKMLILNFIGQDGKKFPVPFPYVNSTSSLNSLLKDAPKPLKAVNKENADGRKLTVHLNVSCDIFSNKGAWSFIISEKNKELFRSFNFENTCAADKLALYGLISSAKTLRAMNPNSVTVYTNIESIVDSRAKGQIVQKYFENNAFLPEEVEFFNFWNELLGLEHFFPFKFSYLKADEENEFYKECKHTCKTILASKVTNAIASTAITLPA